MATSTDDSYTILLMNTGPSSSPAGKRQEAFREVVKEQSPSIIFTQDRCTKLFGKGLGNEYQKIGTAEAGFIFNANKFDVTTFTYDTESLVGKLQKNQNISKDFNFLGRGSVVKFKSKGEPRLEVLAFSWHGPYWKKKIPSCWVTSEMNDDKKVKFMRDLFCLVKEMRKIDKFKDDDGNMLPVIIGGDFNIDFEKWPTETDLVYHGYTPSDRRKDHVKDMFITTKDLDIKDSRFVDLSQINLKDGSMARDLFDHDPIQGMVAYTCGSDLAVRPSIGQKDTRDVKQKPCQKSPPDQKSVVELTVKKDTTEPFPSEFRFPMLEQKVMGPVDNEAASNRNLHKASLVGKHMPQSDQKEHHIGSSHGQGTVEAVVQPNGQPLSSAGTSNLQNDLADRKSLGATDKKPIDGVMSCQLLLMNGTAGTKRSPAKKRQEAFSQIVRDIKPSIIFTQKCTGPFAEILGDEYKKLGSTNAGFIYIADEFRVDDLTNDTDLATLINKHCKEKSISGRLLVGKFTSQTNPDLELLAVSWIGPSVKKDIKIALLKGLFLVAKEMREIKNFKGKADKMLPVIIGGDFKLNFLKWPEDTELVYHQYIPTERRRKKLVDMFVSTKDLTVDNCLFYDLSNVKLIDGTKAFKHDPVKGVLTITA